MRVVLPLHLWITTTSLDYFYILGLFLHPWFISTSLVYFYILGLLLHPRITSTSSDYFYIIGLYQKPEDTAFSLIMIVNQLIPFIVLIGLLQLVSFDSVNETFIAYQPSRARFAIHSSSNRQ